VVFQRELMLVVRFGWRRRRQNGNSIVFALVLGSFISLHEWTSLSLVRIQKNQTQSRMILFFTILIQDVSSKIFLKFNNNENICSFFQMII